MHERQQALEKLLDSWLERSLNPDAFSALHKKFQSVEESAEEWEIFLHFSSIHREAPQNRLQISESERQEAESRIEGWQPHRWGLDEVARARLLLSLSKRGESFFFTTLEKLFESSDMREGETLYRCLPILPWAKQWRSRAAEGVRSNITTVYLAVAHHNPYPATWLDDNAWNQLVLKALFMDASLYRIWGLDKRRNEDQFQMVMDLAHERWAAGRTISPEMWRLATPWLHGEHEKDLLVLLESSDELEREALRNICLESSDKQVQSLLAEHPQQFEQLDEPISWDEIGRRLEERGNGAYESKRT
ncbi:MAG: EboA domain-containing protein [Bacteroidota bacterium]